MVGAGYTGVAAARRMAELVPSEQVLLLESSVVGEGASARNSGFLSVLPSEPRATNSDSVEQAADRQHRIARAGFELLRELVRTHKIDCDWDESAPRITAAATEGGESSARAAFKRYRGWNVECSEYSASELRKTLGTEYYRYGYEPRIRALVQPAALIRGLVDSLPPQVVVLENTPVLSISREGPYRLSTHLGEFVADRVIIANNAHARAFGLLRSRLIGVYTYGALTPRLDKDELDRLGSAPSWGVIPANRVGTTSRKVLGRFLIRSGDSYEAELSTSKVRGLLTRLYRQRHPQMRSYEFEYVWGGITAITHNGGFYFGEIRKGLFASVGCNGGGVVRGSIHGKLLAEMVCGSQSKLLTDRLELINPSWIPPEPFRRIGVASQIKWEQWRAGMER